VSKTLALLSALALACPLAAAGAPAAAAKQQAVVGTWQGTLANGMGGQIRVVLKVTQAGEGGLTATMDSPDQNASDIPVAKIAFENQKMTLDVAAVGGSYEGTLDPAKNEIAGTWKQNGQTIPLLFKKEPARDAPKHAVQ
jgi:spermidine/putrescine-binding protein